MALMSTIRGIPQLYYGSEIGMNGNKSKGDADIRKDFPGGWTDDANNAFLKSGRTPEQEKYFDFTSKILTWRKGNEAVHYGKMKQYIPEKNVYVYFRYTDNKSVMVIINNSTATQTIKTSRFKESLQNYSNSKEIINGISVDLKNDISIDGKSVMILELK